MIAKNTILGKILSPVTHKTVSTNYIKSV